MAALVAAASASLRAWYSASRAAMGVSATSHGAVPVGSGARNAAIIVTAAQGGVPCAVLGAVGSWIAAA